MRQAAGGSARRCGDWEPTHQLSKPLLGIVGFWEAQSQLVPSMCQYTGLLPALPSSPVVCQPDDGCLLSSLAVRCFQFSIFNLFFLHFAQKPPET